MGAARISLVALVATALAGCAALGTPGATSTGSAAAAQAQLTHEFATPAPGQTAAGGSESAVAAVRRFAGGYINWDATTIVARMRSLAAASVGQARSATELAAAQAARDYELKRGGIANHGTVEAVAGLPRRRDQFVVVTREATTATATTAYQGLRPAWHVALATAVRIEGGGWALSSWQPEN